MPATVLLSVETLADIEYLVPSILTATGLLERVEQIMEVAELDVLLRSEFELVLKCIEGRLELVVLDLVGNSLVLETELGARDELVHLAGLALYLGRCVLERVDVICIERIELGVPSKA